MKSTYYRVLDPNTGEEVNLLGTNSCKPYEPNDRCGGCEECLRIQAMNSGYLIQEFEVEVWLVFTEISWRKSPSNMDISRGICRNLQKGGAIVYDLPAIGGCTGNQRLYYLDSTPFKYLHGFVACVELHKHPHVIFQNVMSRFSLEELLVVTPDGFCRWDMNVETFTAGDVTAYHKLMCLNTNPHSCSLNESGVKIPILAGAELNRYYMNRNHPLAGSRHG